jgi:sulfate adenylyltransferase
MASRIGASAEPSSDDPSRRDSHVGIVPVSVGICIWLTGLSGAGKSTIARVLVERLRRTGVEALLLDGDELRTSLWRDLGFSKPERDLHVMRVAALAREAADRGTVAVCALISPYRDARAQVRGELGRDRFIEVFVDTPLDVCEQRDRKCLYARARRGEITHMTGVNDPYEPPLTPDLTLSVDTVEANVERVLAVLADRAGTLE